MIELRKAIQTYLETVHPRVYFQDADPDAAYPYLVFDFDDISSEDEAFDRAILDIEGWDQPVTGDTLPLYQLMETLDGDGDISNPTGLRNRSIMTEDIVLVFRRSFKTGIPNDDDRTIKRVRYTYAVAVHERS